MARGRRSALVVRLLVIALCAWGSALTADAASILVQDFNGVVAPALPAGWSQSGGVFPVWTTVDSVFPSAPNSVFISDPSTITDTWLTSPTVLVPTGTTALTLSFSNRYALESTFDGGVLEISVAGGSFVDVLAAGGAFAAFGYNQLISTSFGNPLGGRQAWSGTNGTFQTTILDLPLTLAGQTVALRWRMGSDNSVSGFGWWVDDVVLDAQAVPEPATLLLLGTGLVGLGRAWRRRRG